MGGDDAIHNSDLRLGGRLGVELLIKCGCTDLRLETTVEFFRRTAQANLNQFEKTIVESKSEAAGTTFEKMQNAVLVDDTDYLIAWWGVKHASPQLLGRFEGESLAYARLGLAIQT